MSMSSCGKKGCSWQLDLPRCVCRWKRAASLFHGGETWGRMMRCALSQAFGCVSCLQLSSIIIHMLCYIRGRFRSQCLIRGTLNPRVSDGRGRQHSNNEMKNKSIKSLTALEPSRKSTYYCYQEPITIWMRWPYTVRSASCPVGRISGKAVYPMSFLSTLHHHPSQKLLTQRHPLISPFLMCWTPHAPGRVKNVLELFLSTCPCIRR
jgi:hypothetical protein